LTPRSFAMVTTFYPPESFGGDGIYVERLSRALAARGHRVRVIACHDAYRACGGRASATDGGAGAPQVTRLASPWGALSPLATQLTGQPFFKRRQIQEALAAESPDVIHFHNVSLVGGPGVLALGSAPVKLYTLHEHWLLCPTHVFWKEKQRLCDVKTCFSCQIRSGRPPQLWRYGASIENGVSHVDLFLAPSRFTAEKHRSEGVRRPIAVLPNFVPEAAPRTESPSRPVFVYAGRLEASKGPDALVAAARRVNAEFRIAGDGPLAQDLARQAHGLANVSLLGRLSSQDVAREIDSATAVVVPSRCLETFGLTAAEALMRGVPVVARRLGALTEIVEETGGGLLFDGDDALADCLARLAADPSLADTLGRRGREAALRLWREDAHVDAYLGHVESLLDSKAKGRA
jgi:glycosyltransferase involved in cell wall biosynthesis